MPLNKSTPDPLNSVAKTLRRGYENAKIEIRLKNRVEYRLRNLSSENHITRAINTNRYDERRQGLLCTQRKSRRI